jgi:hypothetical protein
VTEHVEYDQQLEEGVHHEPAKPRVQTPENIIVELEQEVDAPPDDDSQGVEAQLGQQRDAD